MIVMAMMAVFGLAGVIMLYFYFVARAATLRAGVVADVEEEITHKQRKAQEVDTEFANTVVSGTPVDEAIPEYLRKRAAILPSDRIDNPSGWTNDDLEAWKKREARRRIEDANRRILMPAVGSSLCVITLTLVMVVTYYQFMSGQVGAGVSNGPNGNPPSKLPAALPPIRIPDAPDPPDAASSPAAKAPNADGSLMP